MSSTIPLGHTHKQETTKVSGKVKTQKHPKKGIIPAPMKARVLTEFEDFNMILILVFQHYTDLD